MSEQQLRAPEVGGQDPGGVLEVRGLSKSFGSRKVVRGISFTVHSGEVVGLLGPNGAGKTTSFYMVAGLIAADEGSVLLDGREISALTMDKRANLGLAYLPQEASIFRSLSVEENIMAVLEASPDLARDQAEARLVVLLQVFQLERLRTERGDSLSGGERRRVEIARALARRPRFLLLDEPFSGVDPISVQDLQRLIRNLAQRGMGILITDHNVRETLGTCDRSCIVHEGRMEAEGSAEEILANERVREFYLGRKFAL